MAFNWTNITRGICRDLAREAGMRVSKAEEDLRNRYGEPPNEELVNELWPVLRDRWLGTQPRWRELVIDELRKAKLGDMSLRLSTKTGQMAYLKSCRLSTRLRSAVLEAFVAAGANPMNPPSIMVDTNDSAAPATREAQGRARTQQARRTPAGGELGAYLDQALEQILGEKPYIDEDGDFVIEFGSVVMYVHGEAPSDYIPTVRTFSTLVRDVKLSPSLLSDINEINVKLRFGKVIVVEGGVGINATIPAVSLEINELHAILLEVSGAGDYYDTVLSEKHGGATIGRDAGDVIDA